MEANGKRPRQNSVDPVERALAAWFITQRQKRDKGTIAPDQAPKLLEVEKTWLQTPGKAAIVTAKDGLSGHVRRVIAFFERHGRLPGHTDPADATDYQALRIIWRHYRKGTLSPKETKALRGIPGALKVTRKTRCPALLSCRPGARSMDAFHATL
ncbi:hypothetical protein B1A87_002835 [Arthrobacter sp. KBS0703]|uniref:hypothetical protein n=1 Tax=Arthrobacter sp. KBS0703 TaxID=1955698 RepID=UPI00098F170C|nr:hypothetical protein [Arthrobacter sp. KBS0703]TSE15009.1 hypothetical protein B1A87_002835 [Arthrobacter sp. KBS0703]